jgi:hypothetical protein
MNEPEPESQAINSKPSHAILEGMHKLLLKALRSREQEIFRYLAILGPALSGFFWLLHSGKTLLTVGTIGVQLLLLLGATYSLTLGYNYRYIILELAKLEELLGVKDYMLVGWPRSKGEFLDRYKILCSIPWCNPPEIIRVFWEAFLIGILFVTITACTSEYCNKSWVIPVGIASFLFGVFLPIGFGYKFRKLCNKEPDSWLKCVQADLGNEGK